MTNLRRITEPNLGPLLCLVLRWLVLMWLTWIRGVVDRVDLDAPALLQQAPVPGGHTVIRDTQDGGRAAGRAAGEA